MRVDPEGAGMRRSKRLDATLSVRWVRRGEYLDVEATDIGMHGMFIRTDESTTPGSLLQLVIKLPQRSVHMFVTARFVGTTTSGQGIGVEIFLMEELERRAWREYYRAELQRREPRRKHDARQALGVRASNE